MRKGMAGTKRGYDRCASCGHARIRHMDAGRGACAMAWSESATDAGSHVASYHRCTCEHFTEPTRKA